MMRLQQVHVCSKPSINSSFLASKTSIAMPLIPFFLLLYPSLWLWFITITKNHFSPSQNNFLFSSTSLHLHHPQPSEGLQTFLDAHSFTLWLEWLSWISKWCLLSSFKPILSAHVIHKVFSTFILSSTRFQMLSITSNFLLKAFHSRDLSCYLKMHYDHAIKYLFVVVVVVHKRQKPWE